jgi:hypothetical protein
MIATLLALVLLGGGQVEPGPAVATWYDATRNHAWYTQDPRPGAARRNQDGGPYPYYAAVRGFVWSNKPYQLDVCRTDIPNRCVRVWVVDWCGCYKRRPGREAIDLSPAAFLKLGPLSRGVLPVRLSRVNEKARPIHGAGPSMRRYADRIAQ